MNRKRQSSTASFPSLMVYASYGCNPQFLNKTETIYRPPGKKTQDIQWRLKISDVRNLARLLKNLGET